jgi:hypothetical protein
MVCYSSMSLLPLPASILCSFPCCALLPHCASFLLCFMFFITATLYALRLLYTLLVLYTTIFFLHAKTIKDLYLSTLFFLFITPRPLPHHPRNSSPSLKFIHNLYVSSDCYPEILGFSTSVTLPLLYYSCSSSDSYMSSSRRSSL